MITTIIIVFVVLIITFVISVQPSPWRAHYPHRCCWHMWCFSLQCEGASCIKFIFSCKLFKPNPIFDVHPFLLQMAHYSDRTDLSDRLFIMLDCAQSFAIYCFSLGNRLTLEHIRAVLLLESHRLHVGDRVTICPVSMHVPHLEWKRILICAWHAWLCLVQCLQYIPPDCRILPIPMSTTTCTFFRSKFLRHHCVDVRVGGLVLFFSPVTCICSGFCMGCTANARLVSIVFF